MKRLHALVLAVLLLTCAGARATQPAPVWLSVDEAGYALLQTLDANARVLRVHAQTELKPGVPARTVYLVRTTTAARDALARQLHRDAAHPVGFVAHVGPSDAVVTNQTSHADFTPTRPSYGIDQQATVLPMLGAMSSERIGADILDLSSFRNRYYDSPWGAQAADWLVQQWQAISAGRDDIEIEKVFRPVFAMPSVVLRMRGTQLPDQVLILGGHLDSINWAAGPVPIAQRDAPGADDNASGIADITEVLRMMIEHDYHPARSIHFMAYTGEEVGLYGSAALAADYAARQVDVVGVLQLDMTNYQGSAADIVIIDDDTDPAQNAFLEDLAHYYMPALIVDHDVCGYACSDHASWSMQGYAASFPFEARMGEDNPWIHSFRDNWAASGRQATHARKFARVALAWAVELAAPDTARSCRTARARTAPPAVAARSARAARQGFAPPLLRQQAASSVARCLPTAPLRPRAVRP